jgi:hypothetical protein
MVNGRLQKIRARHVNTSSDKEAVRTFVRRYFEDHRAEIAAVVSDEEELLALDRAMQDLLRCTQRRTPTARYRKVLAACSEHVNRLDVEALARSRQEDQAAFDRRERALLDTLREVSPSAAICYEQGLIDLCDSRRKSWRGTILEFREALREVLDRLAPDEDVKMEQPFGPEAGTKRPTMRDKTLFILRSRGLRSSQIEPTGKATEGVEQIVGGLVRSVYDRASTGVHTEVGIAEAKKVKDWVTMVLLELVEVRR